MKKYAALLLALVMVFALCACGDTGSSNSTTTTATEAPAADTAPADTGASAWDDVEPIKIIYAHANALAETNNKMVDN